MGEGNQKQNEQKTDQTETGHSICPDVGASPYFGRISAPDGLFDGSGKSACTESGEA